eukprot:superscaffoldBa00000010_g223
MSMLCAKSNVAFSLCNDFNCSAADMFPDSAIAWKYSTGKTKVTQLIKGKCNKAIHQDRHNPASHVETNNAWEHISLYNRVDEYQEPACATLELIQQFFVRINPEDGTKCATKTGVSYKTGEMVKRKAVINNSVILALPANSVRVEELGLGEHSTSEQAETTDFLPTKEQIAGDKPRVKELEKEFRRKTKLAEIHYNDKMEQKLFVVDNGQKGIVQPAWVKKMWDNLKQKYKDLECPKEGGQHRGRGGNRSLLEMDSLPPVCGIEAAPSALKRPNGALHNSACLAVAHIVVPLLCGLVRGNLHASTLSISVRLSFSLLRPHQTPPCAPSRAHGKRGLVSQSSVSRVVVTLVMRDHECCLAFSSKVDMIQVDCVGMWDGCCGEICLLCYLILVVKCGL